MRLDGKVAIVTGGGSGIGAASSMLMAERGAVVVVTDINVEAAEQVAEAVCAAGGEATGVHLDVEQPDAIREVLQRVDEEHSGFDILFNNAAILEPEFRSRDSDVVNMDLDVWERTLAINLRGPMLGCKYGIAAMIKRGGGSIIITSSGAARLGDFTRCAYGVSKGGLNSLVKYVATAYGKLGIRCNAIAPGVVLSAGVRALMPDGAIDEWERHHVTPRLGEPADVAAAAAFLASDDSAFITGEILTIDGGLSAHLPTYASTAEQRASAGTSRDR